MSARARWVVFGGALVVMLGLALYWDHRVSLVEINGRRTWIVRAEEDTVALRGEVRPDDALVCVLDGADLRVEHLVDLYTVPGSGRNADGKMIWIEGERIENPPEGEPHKRGVFDRNPMGKVFITCGVEITL